MKSGCIHYKSSSSLRYHRNLRPTSADDRHRYSPSNTKQLQAAKQLPKPQGRSGARSGAILGAGFKVRSGARLGVGLKVRSGASLGVGLKVRSGASLGASLKVRSGAGLGDGLGAGSKMRLGVGSKVRSEATSGARLGAGLKVRSGARLGAVAQSRRSIPRVIGELQKVIPRVES
jgi:hypothetical protein